MALCVQELRHSRQTVEAFRWSAHCVGIVREGESKGLEQP
jgi:hypothetical protein